MAVKPLIVPSYRFTLFFQRVCNACSNNFPKFSSKLLNVTLNFESLSSRFLKDGVWRGSGEKRKGAETAVTKRQTCASCDPPVQ